MKIIEEMYKQYLQNKKTNMKYKYLDRYFQDTTTDKFCFLKLDAHLELGKRLLSESISMMGNTTNTYSVQGQFSVEEIRKFIDVTNLTKVHVFSEMNFDRNTKQKIVDLLNEEVTGVLIPIFFRQNHDVLSILMFYVDECVSNANLIKKFLLEGKFHHKFPVLVGLIMAETISIEPLPEFKDNLSSLSPLVSSDENVFNYIMKNLEFFNSRTVLTIANAKYEGQENYGELVFYRIINTVHRDVNLILSEGCNSEPNPDDTNIAGLENGCKIKFKEACALNWKNAREVRKYLEMSSKKMPLVIAGFFRDFPYDLIDPEEKWKVYGLAETNFKNYDASISFRGDKGFEMSFQFERIFYDGVCYQFLGKSVRNDYITEQIRNVNFLLEQQKTQVINIIKEASKQHHGTMLVFHKEAEREAQRLGKCGRALELEPVCLQNEIENLVQMTSIDGAVIIGFDGMCYALGAILDGIASEDSQRGRGARYNSGLAYVDTQYKQGENCLIAVISEDETIDILVREAKTNMNNQFDA